MKHTISIFCLLAFASVSVLRAEEGFSPLFNGKDLAGWTKKGGAAEFRVEDGCIVVAANDARNETRLRTDKTFENFIFKTEFQYEKDVPADVRFRDPDGAGAADEDLRRKCKEALKPGEWNELEIQCIASSTRIRLNGASMFDRIDVVRDSGFFALCVPASKAPGVARWRNIRVRELPSTPWIPLFRNGALTGVEAVGSGTWTFINPETIYGSLSKDDPSGGLLLSKEPYKNFALRVSFIQGNGNSGLFFRATEPDRERARLRGFQCEITGNHTAGGLWEATARSGEKGRGWFFKPPEDTHGGVYKPGDWNEVAVTAVGDRIVTHLNGRQVVDVVDPECSSEGYTALQLHRRQDMRYWFRNYEVKPIPDDLVELIVR